METIIDMMLNELNNNIDKINKYENEIKLLQDNISKLKNTNETILDMIKLHDKKYNVNKTNQILENITEKIIIPEEQKVIKEKNNNDDNHCGKFYSFLEEIYESNNYIIEDYKHYKFIKLHSTTNIDNGLIIYNMANNDKFEIKDKLNFIYGKVRRNYACELGGGPNDTTYDIYISEKCYKLAINNYGMYQKDGYNAPVFLFEQSGKICLLKLDHKKTFKDNVTILRKHKVIEESKSVGQLVVQLIGDIYVDTEMIINLKNKKKLICDRSWGEWNHDGLEFYCSYNVVEPGKLHVLSKHGVIKLDMNGKPCDKIKYLVKKINKTLLVIDTDDMKIEIYQLDQYGKDEVMVNNNGICYCGKTLLTFEKRH